MRRWRATSGARPEPNVGVTRRPGPWIPACVCDARCLPPPGAVPVVGPLRAALRLVTVVALVAGAVVVLPLFPPAVRRRAQQHWCRGVLAAIGVRLDVRGQTPPDSAALVVSNHVSWLDVLALGAVQPLRMLAGSEVRTWPVVGRLVTGSGALYIDRARLTALPGAVRAVSDALRAGAAVGAFPEGTTWCGRAGRSGPPRSRPRSTRAPRSVRWRCGTCSTRPARRRPRRASSVTSSCGSPCAGSAGGQRGDRGTRLRVPAHEPQPVCGDTDVCAAVSGDTRAGELRSCRRTSAAG